MKFCIFLVLFNSALFCSGQQISNGKSDLDRLLSAMDLKLDSYFESDFLLNNGRYYIPGYQKVKGHPFFNSNKWLAGTLSLGETTYKNVSLIYDLYESRVICSINGGKLEEMPIKLNSDIVTGFSIENHVFVNGNTVPGLIRDEFYEIVYAGKNAKAWLLWKKKFLNTYTREYMGEFEAQYWVMFLDLGDGIQEISSKKGFLEAFGEKSKKIKAFMKKNRMRYSKLTNEQISTIILYADQI